MKFPILVIFRGNSQVKLYVDNKEILPLSIVFNKHVELYYTAEKKFPNTFKTLLANLHLRKIEWWVNNTGIEAKNQSALNFPMTEYFNKTNCIQSTMFNGLHFMVFKEKNNNLLIKYPIIINDDKIKVKILWKMN